MHTTYKLTSAASVEPLTLTEAKAQLHITGTDEDALITSLIKVAREYCENYTNLQFITATWKLYLDYFQYEILIEKNPVLAITKIEHYDTNNELQEVATSKYQLDAESQPARLLEAYGQSFPTCYTKKNAVIITFTAGFGATAATVPEAIKQAMLMIITHLHTNRGDEGHRTFPNTINLLLDPYRITLFK